MTWISWFAHRFEKKQKLTSLLCQVFQSMNEHLSLLIYLDLLWLLHTQGLCMWVSLFRFKTKYFIPIKQLNKNIKRDWISKSAFQGCVVCVQKHVVFCSVTLLNSLCLILIILNMLQIFMAQDMVYLGISSVGTWKECIFCCFGVEYSINQN